jgi:hypothetical protein
MWVAIFLSGGRYADSLGNLGGEAVVPRSGRTGLKKQNDRARGDFGRDGSAPAAASRMPLNETRRGCLFSADTGSPRAQGLRRFDDRRRKRSVRPGVGSDTAASTNGSPRCRTYRGSRYRLTPRPEGPARCSVILPPPNRIQPGNERLPPHRSVPAGRREFRAGPRRWRRVAADLSFPKAKSILSLPKLHSRAPIVIGVSRSVATHQGERLPAASIPVFLVRVSS